jgi:PBP1b-binding outer membrane lipoprotein LpoB
MARERKAKTIVAVALLALTLSACGAFGGKSDEDKVRDTVDALVVARNQHHFAKVCSLIASAQLAKFKQAGTTCAKALPRLAQKATTTTIRIEQVRVSGDRATVDATVSHNAGAGSAQTILLIKEGGDWKISQVGF